MSEKKYVYVVMEKSYEYNDEYFYSGEYGGGNPCRAYSTEEEAKKVARELNIDEVRCLDSIFSYDYFSECVEEEVIVNFLRDVFGEEHIEGPYGYDIGNWSPPATATDEQLGKLVDFLAEEGVYFNYVERVELKS